LNYLAIRDTAADEFDFAFDAIEIGLLSIGEVVQHNDVVAAADKLVHRIGADEPGAARDQVAHCRSLLETSSIRLAARAAGRKSSKGSCPAKANRSEARGEEILASPSPIEYA